MKAADVPAGPLLVDTDVFSWLAWGRQRHEEFGGLIRGHQLAVSFATVAELRAGAIKAGWQPERRAKLQLLLDNYVVLTSTDAVTHHFAEIYAAFKGQLRGDGINDMWIAACALAQSAVPPVVTGNLSDFQRMATRFPALRLVHPDL